MAAESEEGEEYTLLRGGDMRIPDFVSKARMAALALKPIPQVCVASRALTEELDFDSHTMPKTLVW